VSTSRDTMSASLIVVGFLQKYTESLSKQIEAVQEQMDISVSGVMTALQDLSASTEDKKREAELVLEQTYLAPDANTSAMVDSIQKSADDIFEQATKSLSSPTSASPANIDGGADIRRMGGLFSKHMESMSTLDDSLKDIVLGMVGSMSNNDVVKQRLDHSMMSLRALHLGLANILVDLEGRLKVDVIRDFKENLLEYTYKSFTTEGERNAFKAIFGAPPSVQKAYSKTS
jgi:hypothetical protein